MWTVDFYRQYRPHLTMRSIAALRRTVLAGAGLAPTTLLDLQLKTPRATLRLRPATTDLWTFDDVFRREIYGAARAASLRTIIDVGANIGIVSLYLLRDSPDARVFALEPDPDNFALLTHNLPLKAVQLERGALWHSDCPVTFAPATPTTGQVGPGGGITVPGYTMATLVARSGFPSIDLLKVDVEGAERHLFAGDRRWLAGVRRCVVEWHEDAREACDFDRIMAAAGFSVRNVGPQVTYASRDI